MDSSLDSRIKAIRADVTNVQSYRGFLRQQTATATKEEANLQYQADLHQKCSEVIKTWLEDSLKSNVDSIADLATSGLRHVINDQELTFRIRQDPKYNRIAISFVLEEPGSDEGNPMDSFGGGAVLTISLVMRIAVMARMRMANLLLLDESMSALANQYVPNAASFMKHLSEETGINILMVTHNDEFIGQAHTAYEGEKNTSLHLRHHRVVR